MDQYLGIPELIDYLARFLDIQSLAACVAVSRSWRLLWTRLLYQSPPQIDAAVQFYQYGHFVQRLHWRLKTDQGLTTDQGLDLARLYCHHLQSVSLDSAHAYQFEWNDFWSHFLGLQSKDDAFSEDSEPTVEELRLWQSNHLISLSPETNGFLSASVQSLKLEISGGAREALEALTYARLYHQHRTLNRFHYTAGCEDKDKNEDKDKINSGIGQVQESPGAILSCLKKLTIEEDDENIPRMDLSVRLFQALLVAYPTLETLSTGLVRISDTAIRGQRDIVLGDDIDSMLASVLSYMNTSSEDAMIPTTSRLRTLVMILHDPDHSILPRLFAWVPQLQSLTLRLSYFSFESLRTIVRCCPKLKTLVLRSGEHSTRPAIPMPLQEENEHDSDRRERLESLSKLRFHRMILYDSELDYITRRTRGLEELSLIYRRPSVDTSPPKPPRVFRPTWMGLRRAITVNCRWLTTLRLRYVTDLPADFFWLEQVEEIPAEDAISGLFAATTAKGIQSQTQAQAQSYPQSQVQPPQHLTTAKRQHRIKEWPCAKTLETVVITEVLFRDVNDNRVFRRNLATWINLRDLTLRGQGIWPEAVIPDGVTTTRGEEEEERTMFEDEGMFFPRLTTVEVHVDRQRRITVDQAKVLVETMPALDELNLLYGLSEEADRWLSEFRPLLSTF